MSCTNNTQVESTEGHLDNYTGEHFKYWAFSWEFPFYESLYFTCSFDYN